MQNYAAPEIIDNAKPYDEKVDMWSLGCCLFMMLVGEHPFDSDNEAAMIKNILAGSFLNSKWKKEKYNRLSKGAKEMIAGLIEVESDKRMWVDEIMLS